MTTTLKITATAVLITLLAVASAWTYLNTHTSPMAQCASEDTTQGPCYWDASTQGNHRGMSFIVHANGEITYVATHKDTP